MTWTNARLIAVLESVETEIEWPGGSDLAPRVVSQLSESPRRRVRWVAIAATALAVMFFTLTPLGHEAVAWLLRISGIRVELTETSIPMSPPTKLIDELEVTPEEAENAVGFELHLPAELPAPDSVQLVDWGGGQQVAMLWNQSSQLPEVMETGVGLLLLQFEAEVDQELLVKGASEATRINPVSVNGDTGYFLSGAPHIVFFLGPDGVIADDQIRLAGNVLVWMSDGITYRIESALDLEEAVRVAESLG